jgi:5'-nucleotidase
MRNLRIAACVAVLIIGAAACQLTSSAVRHTAAPATVSTPFWCAPTGGTELGAQDCQSLSIELDSAALFANYRYRAAAALGYGAVSSAYQSGVGAAFRFSGPTASFSPLAPDTLLYDSTAPSAQVAGIEWNVASVSAPAGFVGPNDVWDDLGGGVWRLRAWILRPFQNQPDVFADTHPCLAGGSAVYDVNAPCYAASHPNPLRILVSNDDGYDNPGIDAVVQGLLTLPNVDVTVSAPATQQSGTGGSTSPDPLTATQETTLSGYPVTAVQGFPADSVRYALRTLHVDPELLVSGINDGQNLGPFVNLSGTVGAARVGAREGIPAVAVSQGFGSPPDFPSGRAATLAWVNDFLLGRVGPNVGQTVANINIPTCTAGSIRGTLVLPGATNFNSGSPLAPANCQSTVTTIPEDVAGFLNGFITITSIGT